MDSKNLPKAKTAAEERILIYINKQLDKLEKESGLKVDNVSISFSEFKPAGSEDAGCSVNGVSIGFNI